MSSFSAEDFESQEPAPARGRGQRTSMTTEGYTVYRQTLLGNAESAKKRQATRQANIAARQMQAASTSHPNLQFDSLQTNTFSAPEDDLYPEQYQDHHRNQQFQQSFQQSQSFTNNPDTFDFNTFNFYNDSNEHNFDSRYSQATQVVNEHQAGPYTQAFFNGLGRSTPSPQRMNTPMLTPEEQDEIDADPGANAEDGDLPSSLILPLSSSTMRAGMASGNSDISSSRVVLPQTPVARKTLRPAALNGLSQTPVRAGSARPLIRHSHMVEPTIEQCQDDQNKENDSPNQVIGVKRVYVDDSSSSDATMTGSVTKRQRLVMANVTLGRERVQERSFLELRSLLVSKNPFPKKLEMAVMEATAWSLALDYLIENKNHVGRPEPTSVELGLIGLRVSQHRGIIKKEAWRIVSSPFNPVWQFKNPIDDDEETIEANRALVAELLDTKRFVYQNPFDVTIPGTLMRSVLISQIINAVYFAKKADSEGLVPGFFANNEIPLRTIALIVTSIENCIDEWKLGENKEISFTRKEYNVKFEAHLLSLHNWETVSRKGSNSLQKYQRDLFACGRSFAGMSRIPVTDSSLTTESSFSAADFEADEVRASVS